MARAKKQDEAVVAVEAIAPAVGKVVVTPVYGVMIHQFTSTRIEGPTEFEVLDTWLESQIEAGKLKLG